MEMGWEDILFQRDRDTTLKNGFGKTSGNKYFNPDWLKYTRHVTALSWQRLSRSDSKVCLAKMLAACCQITSTANVVHNLQICRNVHTID